MSAWMGGATQWKMLRLHVHKRAVQKQTPRLLMALQCVKKSPRLGQPQQRSTVDVLPDSPNVGTFQERNVNAGLESLDEVDLVSIFNRGANVMRSVPLF